VHIISSEVLRAFGHVSAWLDAYHKPRHSFLHDHPHAFSLIAALSRVVWDTRVE